MDYSYQLYSARNAGPLDDSLAMLKAAGYRQVEGWGGLYTDPPALAESLRNNGLTMPTAHFGLSDLMNTAKSIETATTLGIKTLICPAIGKEERTQDRGKWAELGRTLASLGETFTAAGFGFGWHNHDFEFVKNSDGSYPMDIILETAPALEWEFDVAWGVKGGIDPLQWMDKYGNRITAIHVKDIAPAGQALDEDGWADVGQGTLDWPTLIAAAKSKTRAKYFVMEHDKPSDAARFARRSMDATKGFA